MEGIKIISYKGCVTSLGSPLETLNVANPAKRKYCDIISAFLGLLGAVNLLLIAFYILTIYLSVSAIPPMEQLVFQVYFVTILTAVSAIMLIYGSYLIWKTNRRKGGMINLSAATVIPIPTYLYFAFLSQPTLLNWLSPFGCFLLVPAIVSGAISIFFHD